MAYFWEAVKYSDMGRTRAL